MPVDDGERVKWIRPPSEEDEHPTFRYDPEYPDVPEHVRINYFTGCPRPPTKKEKKD